MPQVTGQMPAMVAAPPPTYPAPHDFFILALVTHHHLWHPQLDIPGIWLTSDHSCSNGNNDY